MKKNRTFKNFQDWNSVDIALKLGVKKSAPTATLQHWLTAPSETIPESTAAQLDTLRARLDEVGTEWNEAELIHHFITPLLNSIAFLGTHYSSFLQRKIAAEVHQHRVQGIVDYMVATGVYEPEKPYFFIHEYKRFKGTEADPLGQLLITMLAAQQLNNDGQPLYGCYVFGAIWNFVLLEGNLYSHSQVFDARDKQELQIIWKILYHTKIIIEESIRQQELGK
jgi:hypothetical protein